MIRTVRRGFWLTVGAAVGVGGYRKVVRLARAGAGPVRAGPAAARLARGARASARFAGDVREGMRIYRLANRRQAPASRRAARDRAARDWAFAQGECSDEVKDGR